MLPIAVLPAAALLLRLGQPDLLNLPWMAAAGDAVFANLAVIFALGIAVGLSAGEGVAGLAALVGYFVFTGVFNAIIPQVNGKPDPAIHMGVPAGILIGVTAALLYRRFHDIRLPDYLGFFGGKRFVPIITALASLGLGAICGLIWPPIQAEIDRLGQGIVGLGPFGPALYGTLNRLLIPVGLHHVINTYVWFQLGTYPAATGPVHGDLNRYFAGDPAAGDFMAGFFPIMMFGLPAAGLAMIRQARVPKGAGGILLSAALASFLTGITEPLEFAFVFVAPGLFLLHALLTGTALLVCTLLGIKIGFGFSAGLIDYGLNFGKANTTHPLWLLAVGAAYAIIYYAVFSFCIRRFNLATPGRGEPAAGTSADWILPESQRAPRPGASSGVPAADPADTLAAGVVAALGGIDNIVSCEGCITRLRLFVEEPAGIDEAALRRLGAAGVVQHGKIVQVVMGTQSDRLAARIKQMQRAGAGVPIAGGG
jgi:PTS system N-acetylglucosamine-specific IIC component